ncbi:MAG TPA: response regulator, partial [Herpetosiphonaceae bacterium]
RKHLIKPIREELLLASVRHSLQEPGAPILVVDDSPDARDIIQTILAGQGYAAETVANGREALEWLERRQPGLIILDLMMPEVDGFEVLARLRDHPDHQHIPVIIVSAKELEAHEQSWLLNRAQGLIAKRHLSADEFVARVQQVFV